MIDYRRYYKDDNDRIDGLFERWAARCPVTGIELHWSHGRSRGLPKFHVYAPDLHISHWTESKNWRYSSRAASNEEAIEKAANNKKVQSWYELIWRREFNKIIAD